jgi:hypothetical protein
MLYGTDINHAFAFSLDHVQKGHGGGGAHRNASFSKYDTDEYGDGHGSTSSYGSPSMESGSHSSSSGGSSSGSSTTIAAAAAAAARHADSSIASTDGIPLQQPLGLSADSDVKLEKMASELEKTKRMLDRQKNDLSYMDRLLSRRRDIAKLLMFMLVIVLALSIHHIIKHYYKAFFQENSFTSGKEFGIRATYPLIALFLIWNLRVFAYA